MPCLAPGHGRGHARPTPVPPPPIARPSSSNRPKLSSKRRTNLKICVPEAKFIKESDFDVKTRLTPPKSTENDETHVSETEQI